MKISLKFMLAKFALSGKTFDRGAPIFKTFSLLIRIRTEIIHPKPIHSILRKDLATGEMTWTAPAMLHELQQKGIIGVNERLRLILQKSSGEELRMDATSPLRVASTAIWACHTVRNTIDEVLDAIPESHAGILAVPYCDSFAFPPDIVG